MPEAVVATVEAASTITKAASVETRLVDARLMVRRTERMTQAAPPGCGREPASARAKRVSRRSTRREAAAVTGRCRSPTTTTCVTLCPRWNQRQQQSKRRKG